MKRVRPRADQEIDLLAGHIAQDNLNATVRFLKSVLEIFDMIGAQPGICSLRYAHLPMLNGLRVCLVTGFENHLIFYIEPPDYIDVIRVLHSARDLPAALTQYE